MKTNHHPRTPKVFITLFSVILLATGLSSCKKDDNNNPTVSAYIMATNSAEGSVGQDFLVDNNKANASTMAYTQSTTYTAVKAGDHELQFRSSGTTTVNSTTSLNAGAGNYYSVFYLDDKSTVTVQDDQTAPQSGKARVRFINLSSFVTSNVDFGVTAGNKLATALARKAVSAYYEVDAATAFSLYAAGSTSVLLSIPVTLQAGKIYTVYVSGSTQATLSYHLILNK